VSKASGHNKVLQLGSSLYFKILDQPKKVRDKHSSLFRVTVSDEAKKRLISFDVRSTSTPQSSKKRQKVGRRPTGKRRINAATNGTSATTTPGSTTSTWFRRYKKMSSLTKTPNKLDRFLRPQFTKVRNRLECLSQAGLSSIV
jgi:hypothetical protein